MSKKQVYKAIDRALRKANHYGYLARDADGVKQRAYASDMKRLMLRKAEHLASQFERYDLIGEMLGQHDNEDAYNNWCWLYMRCSLSVAHELMHRNKIKSSTAN